MKGHQRYTVGLALWVSVLSTMQAAAVPGDLWVDPAHDAATPGWGVTAFATIETAVAAANAGDTVHVAAGTYALAGTLNITKSLTLAGASEAGVVIDASGNGTGYGLRVEADNVTLSTFTLLPPVVPASLGTSAGGGYAIHASFNHATPYAPYANLTMEHITIENGNRTAFDIHGYDGVTLTDLTANHAAYGNGIQLTGCTGVTITGCAAAGNAWGGLAFYCSKASYLDRPCSGTGYDLSANSIDDVYVEDEFGLVNTVAVSGASFRIDNAYAADAAMHRYTAADAATAATAAGLLNTKYGNTLSVVTDLVTGHHLVSAGMSIQAAVDAASPGDTIDIGAGTYDETVNIDAKNGLSLIGAGEAATVIRSSGTISWAIPGYPAYDGRMTVIRLVDATGLTIKALTLDCELSRGAGGYPGVFGVFGWNAGVTLDTCTVKNMSVDDAGGGYYEMASYFRAPGYTDAARVDVTVTGCTFIDGGRVAIVTHDYITGTITGNVFYKTTDDFGYAVEMGSQSEGLISGNVIYGYDTAAASDGSESAGIYVENAFTGGSPAMTKDVTVSNNEVYGCQYAMWIGNGYDGFAGDVDIRVTLAGNHFHGNVEGAVILQDEDKEAGSSVTLTGSGNTYADNGNVGLWVFTQGDGDVTVNLSGESVTGHAVGLLVEDYGTGGGSSYAVSVADCRLAGNTVHAIENTVAGLVVSATPDWWGAADGPSGEGPGSGDAVSVNVTYDPWWADEAMTTLVYEDDGTIDEDGEVAGDETVTVPGTLTVAAGTTLVVRGRLEAGRLDLEAGASIEVIDGELVLGTGDGGTHTIAGTFTVYNSFGSVAIAGDTEFSGSTLFLISDIHVADGVTLTVSGSLVLDGCVVDCADAGGRFALEVASGGALTMERTHLADADLTLSGSGALVRNNRLADVAVTVAGGAADNAVYHNVFEGTTALTDSGSATVTSLDQWGNVASLAATVNDLGLDLAAPADAGRTLEGGNVYVQPGDVVVIDLAVEALGEKIQGVEAMLGFNTEYFNAGGASSLGAVAPWEYELHNVWTSAGLYGKVDTAIGLGIAYPDPEGTRDDGPVAQVALETLAREGVTMFYFRPRLSGDSPSVDTRLTAAPAGSPHYLAPFTLNSGMITIDGTDPSADTFTASQVQEAGTADVFTSGVITVQGTVVFTVDAYDGLAGLTTAGPEVELVLQSNPAVTLTPTQLGSAPVTVGAETWTRYTYGLEIHASTANGVYDATVTVADRSGNTTVLSDTLEVNKNQVAVSVELEGAVAGPFTRDVVLKATDAGGTVLQTWTRTLTFTGGTATDTLVDVDGAVVALSAKTAWTLRVKVASVPDGDGQATADFTGADLLPGGDVNGDNAVNMLDFARLRYFWYTAASETDIDGSGATTASDFAILQSNWYTAGDPE